MEMKDAFSCIGAGRPICIMASMASSGKASTIDRSTLRGERGLAIDAMSCARAITPAFTSTVYTSGDMRRSNSCTSSGRLRTQRSTAWATFEGRQEQMSEHLRKHGMPYIFKVTSTFGARAAPEELSNASTITRRTSRDPRLQWPAAAPSKPSFTCLTRAAQHARQPRIKGM